MIDKDIFRQMALSFPNAVELPHFEKTSFRINKKIFATLDERNNSAVVKLSPLDQSVFCTFDKTVMYPVNGTRGRQGWTVIELDNVKKGMLRDALKTAYQDVKTKKTWENRIMKSETPKHNNVEEYYSSMPTQAKIKLYEMREIIKSVVPLAEEVISYGMPAFKQNGILVYFAGYKNHIGFYPTSSGIKTFKNEFADYKWSKGAVQFPIDEPLPKMLIKRVVKFRAKEDKEKTTLKKVMRNNKNSKAENYVKYHNDGSIWAKGKVINNVPEGYWEWFRKGGTIMRSGYFSKGKQVGEWTTYDNKGKVFKVTVIK